MNYNTFRWITTRRRATPWGRRGPTRSPARSSTPTSSSTPAWSAYYKQEQRLYRTTTGRPADAGQPDPGGPPRVDLPAAPAGARGQPGPGTTRPASRADPGRRRARPRLRRTGPACASAPRTSRPSSAWRVAAPGRHAPALKPGDKLPDELIHQAVKETVMHEVGHTLGLRHNFKASTMLKNDQLHDPAVTRKQGLVGSVMDYTPVNLAPKGTSRATTSPPPSGRTTTGPSSTPTSRSPAGRTASAELAKIAGRGGRARALTTRPTRTCTDRRPARQPVGPGGRPDEVRPGPDAAGRGADEGAGREGGGEGRGLPAGRGRRSASLLQQYGNAAFLAAQYVGGEHVHRDHKGDPNGPRPVRAGHGRRSSGRRCKFLQDHILTDKPFSFPPELLRKLAADRWLHWGNEQAFFGGVDFPVNDRVLGIQRVVLREPADRGYAAAGSRTTPCRPARTRSR